MSFVKKYYKEITAFLLFMVALVVATFFDLPISRAIVDLLGGNYYSSNIFGRVVETVGECPIYLVWGACAGILFWGALSLKNNKLKYILSAVALVVAMVAFAVMPKRIIGYICEHFNLESWEEESRLVIWLISIAFSVCLTSLTLYIEGKIPTDKRIKLVFWSVASLLGLAISEAFVHGIKGIFGRQRYRAIYVLEYNGLEELAKYTKWFVINGKTEITEQMSAVGIISDSFKSFPSGHTCSAAVIFAICIIPDFICDSQNKISKSKCILICISLFYTLLVAYARILVGAHFLSDVLIGGGATIFSMWISKIIVKTLVKRRANVVI